MKSSLLIASVLTLGLAACGSAPVTSYYTLMTPAGEAAPPATPSAAARFAIEVQPVGVPEALDQPQIVIRKSDNALMVLEHERWSAPLSEELRAALSARLSRQLGAQDVAGLGAPAASGVLRIKLQVRRFDAWPDQRVNLDADWSIVQSNDTQTRLSCHTAVAQTTSGGYAGMVAAQQRALSQLSQAIAAAASGWPQAKCPSEAVTGAAGG